MSLLTKIDASAEIFLALLPKLFEFHSEDSKTKTSSCPDTSCVCRAAPRCGCSRTPVNLIQPRQRRCPAGRILHLIHSKVTTVTIYTFSDPHTLSLSECAYVTFDKELKLNFL